MMHCVSTTAFSRHTSPALVYPPRTEREIGRASQSASLGSRTATAADLLWAAASCWRASLFTLAANAPPRREDASDHLSYCEPRYNTIVRLAGPPLISVDKSSHERTWPEVTLSLAVIAPSVCSLHAVCSVRREDLIAGAVSENETRPC